MTTHPSQVSADATRDLIRLLRAAYSGELAAANAYAGHWRSVRERAQRTAIRRIQDEEHEHRARVGEMIAELGGTPGWLRDRVMAVVGWMIAAACFVGGWYVPMYGAGLIERRNIAEYEDAAQLAFRAGREDLADELLGMAEAEWDHEAYFRGLCEGHWLRRVLRVWRPPPPREAIRARYVEAVAA